MWLKVCPKGTIVGEDSRLCDKHFPTSNFFLTPKKRFKKLNHDAVPLSETAEFVGKYHKQPRIEQQGIEQDVGQQDSSCAFLTSSHVYEGKSIKIKTEKYFKFKLCLLGSIGSPPYPLCDENMNFDSDYTRQVKCRFTVG